MPDLWVAAHAERRWVQRHPDAPSLLAAWDQAQFVGVWVQRVHGRWRRWHGYAVGDVVLLVRIRRRGPRQRERWTIVTVWHRRWWERQWARKRR